MISRSTSLHAVENEQFPRVVIDAAGLRVDTSGSAWRLNEPSLASILIDWNELDDAPEDAVVSLKGYVISLIKRRSPAHTRNSFRRIRDYLLALNRPSCPSDGVDAESLLWYLKHLRAQKEEYLFHNVRAWCKWAADHEYPGFEDDVVREIVDVKIGGNAKGVAVMSADPEEGPLDEFEEAALRNALLSDTGPIDERAAVWLLLGFGVNPANAALLEEQDRRIVATDDPDLPVLHELQMPRIKKRAAPRSDFKIRKLDDHLAAIFDDLIQSNQSRQPGPGFDRPLFWRHAPRKIRLNSPLHKFAYFLSAAEITLLAQRCIYRLRVVSPRTGKLLHITTRRLRYTFACKMVRQGASAHELAELLDHTDLQNVLVYFASSSELIPHLDRALAEQMGALVRAFLGQLVGPECENADDARITTIDLTDVADIGKCGATFQCRLAPPITCYTCDRFQAFTDGPHAEMLESLISRRDRLMNEGNHRIAVQLDGVILAIGALLHEIRKPRGRERKA